MLTFILICLVLVLLTVSIILVVRLFQHDLLNSLIISDIDDFTFYMDSIMKNELAVDVPEYIQIHRNLKELNLRLQLHSVSVKKRYKRNKKVSKNPPVVI